MTDIAVTPKIPSELPELHEETFRTILMGMLNQLRRDMDLYRITLPACILEPRSMLEKVTDFLSHPDYILQASKEEDPLQRFLAVVRYFLSGWHIQPKGVKKPYNPVLGEFFRCKYKYNNGTEGYFVSEQVSHHPPISAFYYGSPENGIHCQGNLRPKFRFLGNSAGIMMEGENQINLTKLQEKYDITMPNMYVRGILLGKMGLELGDTAIIRCAANDLICELDFKTKGFFSGEYKSVSGTIKKESTGKVLFEISGQWADKMYIKPAKSSKSELFLDVYATPIQPQIIEDLSKQDPMESKRHWSKVTAAIYKNDMNAASDEKTVIEERQRREARKRKDEKKGFTPRYFNMGYNGHIEMTGHNA
ncbi:hypothetical protein BDB01DRAFT_773828 [Pilobolus umbonatus]|nr:hypothetical protein BDB01DRAFT_773828 [Pilobolus umbonatus]